MTDNEKIHIIEKVVKAYRGCPEFGGNNRKRELVQVRQEAHYFAKKFTNMSLSKIGARIGGKNHATVLYSEKVVKDIISYDKKYAASLTEMEILIASELHKYKVGTTVELLRHDTMTFAFNNIKEKNTCIELKILRFGMWYIYYSEPNKIKLHGYFKHQIKKVRNDKIILESKINRANSAVIA